MMRNNQCSLVEELVGDANSFIQQSTGILAKIKNQTFESTLLVKLIKRVGNFMFSGFVESGDVHVAHAWTDKEVQIHAVAGNLRASYGEVERLVRAFTQNTNVNGGAAGTFEQVSNVTRVHVVGGF